MTATYKITYSQMFNDHQNTLKALNNQLADAKRTYENALIEARKKVTDPSMFSVNDENFTFIPVCPGKSIESTCSVVKKNLDRAIQEVKRITELQRLENETFESNLLAMGFDENSASQLAQESISQAQAESASLISFQGKAPYIIVVILLVMVFVYFVFIRKKK